MKPFSAMILSTCLLLGGVAVAADSRLPGEDVVVPPATDLSSDARLSRERQLPIMVVFSSEDCAYCTLLEEEFLKPMIISGDYTNKVILRMLDISSGDTLLDFRGRSVDADNFASEEGIFVTPIIKFYDDRGNELAPKMIGINTVEFYGWYLDQSIDASLKRLRTGYENAGLDESDPTP